MRRILMGWDNFFYQGIEPIVLWVAALLFIYILAIFFYFYVYKRIMKGKRELSKRTIILSSLTIMYIFVVFTVVFLGRISRGDRAYILYPFYSYREAWNDWSTFGWGSIILNIVMFIPLGILLPLWSEKLHRYYKVAFIGFLFTLFIECVQYVLRLGVFEVDDLIHNTLGTLIGYGIIMIILSLINKRKLKVASVFLYLIPALLAITAFAVIFGVYNLMELGTLGASYSYPMDMDKVKVVSDISYSTESSKAMIYKAPYYTASEAEEFIREFFSLIDSSTAEDGNVIDDEHGIFYSDDRSRHMWVTFRGGNYNYSDFDYGPETGAKAIKASEEEVRKALSAMNIYVTKEASFHYDDVESWFVFQVDLIEERENAFSGTLSGKYYEDSTIKDINNNMLSLKYYREAEIISEDEAFKRILDGKFTLGEI